MYSDYKSYRCPYYYDPYNINNYYGIYSYPYYYNIPKNNSDYWNEHIKLNDYGPEPFVVNIEEVTKKNNNFRTALWTGKHLQLTLMSIDIGSDIGLEIHRDLDQFIRIEQGQGLVQMGDKKDKLNFQKKVYDDYAIFIPAGKWHNLINTGYKPLKLYSIYAPPEHPHGTVHKTKADAEADKENHCY
ncbi:cupin domain-containing protein [Clostridium sp. D2Q-14]|uniref:cupin domain-containing protein n=1 Tax=Anaeromonas gelatinilytica TaxID=2683194 RepID=UPI00193B02C6|nr:cupin domain-containing protein [Anaeromonas gelatinilytica]MBS4536304.1 cupin domain-containing protein [Anaeromonas gelatinilytica]